jgi:hypothetical protein
MFRCVPDTITVRQRVLPLCNISGCCHRWAGLAAQQVEGAAISSIGVEATYLRKSSMEKCRFLRCNTRFSLANTPNCAYLPGKAQQER